MKHLSQQIYLTLFFLLLMAGCIAEDQSDCPPATSVVRLSFAQTTPCETTPVYPTDIDSLHLFVFNADGLFVGEYIHSDIQIGSDFYCDVPLPTGKHTIVTWAGTGNASQTTPDGFIEGETTFSKAILSVRKEHLTYTGTTDSVLVCNSSLYFGSVQVEGGSTQLVELTKNTSGIRVSVSGLNTQDTYRLVITGDDQRFNFDNTFTSYGELNYIQPLVCNSEGCAQASTHILNPGKGNRPTITITETESKKELLHEDLVKLIYERIPDINFDCVHDFDIEITFNTDLSVSISVNGWDVNEEESDL